MHTSYDTVDTTDLTPTLRVRVVLDNSPHNPMDDSPDCSIAYRSYSRNTLGTEAVSDDRMDEIADGIRKGTLIGMPVYAYVHSGVSLKAADSNPFHCGWDSGQSGFVYCTRETALDRWGHTNLTQRVKGQALAYMVAEVKAFSDYLNGECYGFVVERVTRDEAGDITGVEELDACWGYLGCADYCMTEGLHSAEHFLQDHELV